MAEQSKDTVQAPAEDRRVRDTRHVLSGVTLGERTYSDSDEDRDALEAVLTEADVLRLKGRGAISGDWRPRGKDRPPMQGSKLERESRAGTGRPAPTDEDMRDAVREIERLRRQNAEQAEKLAVAEKAAARALQNVPPPVKQDVKQDAGGKGGGK